MKKPALIAALFLFLAVPSFAQPLTLKESLDIALTHNQSVIDAQGKVDAANAKLGEATSGFLPKFSLSASEGPSYSQPTDIILPAAFGGGAFPTGPDEASKVTSYSFNFQQTLFAGGRVIAGWQIADVGYQAAREDLRRVQNETELNVTSAFYGLLKAEKGLEVIKSSISNMERNVEQTKIFYDSGIGSNLDLLRAETMLANLNINRIQADNGAKLARLAFENVLGKKRFRSGRTKC